MISSNLKIRVVTVEKAKSISESEVTLSGNGGGPFYLHWIHGSLFLLFSPQ